MTSCLHHIIIQTSNQRWIKSMHTRDQYIRNNETPWNIQQNGGYCVYQKLSLYITMWTARVGKSKPPGSGENFEMSQNPWFCQQVVIKSHLTRADSTFVELSLAKWTYHTKTRRGGFLPCSVKYLLHFCSVWHPKTLLCFFTSYAIAQRNLGTFLWGFLQDIVIHLKNYYW